jgi:hypothetical protein
VSERIKRVFIRRDYVVHCYGERSNKFSFEYLQKDGTGIEPGSKYAFARITAPEDFEVVVAVLKISVIVVRPSLVPPFNKSEPATKNYELVWDLRGTPSVSSCPAE